MIGLYVPYYSAVIGLLCILAVMYLLCSVINYLNNYMYAKVSIELSTLLRFDMFEKLQKLPISYFQNEADGRIVSKITNDTDAVRNFFSTIISIIIEEVRFVDYVGLILILRRKQYIFAEQERGKRPKYLKTTQNQTVETEYLL